MTLANVKVVLCDTVGWAATENAHIPCTLLVQNSIIPFIQHPVNSTKTTDNGSNTWAPAEHERLGWSSWHVTLSGLLMAAAGI